MENALRFYIGYLNTQNAGAFLPQAISSMMIGTMDNYARRVGSQLYKLAVEQNLCNHILAEDTDMDARDYSPKWPDGKKHARNVYAHTREECEEKLKVLIVEMKTELAELKRQKAEGALSPQEPKKDKKEGRKKKAKKSK